MPSKTTLVKALERCLWAMIMGGASAFVAMPINITNGKQFWTALAVAMLTGALLGLQKLISGYFKYDR
jgi:hypothetical protein